MTVIEVEIKVPIIERDTVKKGLIEMGSKYLGCRVQTDTYYNARDRDFALTDEALRVRRDSEKAVLTYKGPKIGTLSKSRKEVELGIEDPATAEELLTSLGYSPVLTVTKQRHIYRLDHYIISLDSVAGLGDFLEIETFAEYEHEIPSNVEKMKELLQGLGIEQDSMITRSYLELLIDKRDSETH